MRPFRIDDGPAYVARIEAPERAVLLDVVDGVVDLLLGGAGAPPGGASDDPFATLRLGTGPVRTPTDPALLRLLPDAAADPELAAELRRLTEADLRGTKVGHLRRLRAVLDAARPDAVVVPSDAAAVAAALTDLRLVLASRLGVLTDDDAESVYDLAQRDGPVATQDEATARFLATVYAVLTELQESLVQLMVDALPPVRDGGAV
ncbi:DUF2017 family protein [Actinotalea sp.]|uniref:DUF2017 family protein n=1 Tax=Actinotalea sp. TaxID=1872145 RepID=UPI002BCAA882|nr:DUF2017 family protein [Actinotalea sp.]HQY33506.1 DUF2017 family protein [Actinotalea sp.]HRA49423.1 DUF2017 family protein [Actinotalea sp.]